MLGPVQSWKGGLLAAGGPAGPPTLPLLVTGPPGPRAQPRALHPGVGLSRAPKLQNPGRGSLRYVAPSSPYSSPHVTRPPRFPHLCGPCLLPATAALRGGAQALCSRLVWGAGAPAAGLVQGPGHPLHTRLETLEEAPWSSDKESAGQPSQASSVPHRTRRVGWGEPTERGWG